MRFSQLITSSELPQQWVQRVDGDRVPGAILLSGPQGAELLPFARSFIAYLQCENRRPATATTPADSCGECLACRQVGQLAHPDVLFSFPVIGTGATGADFMAKWRSEVLTNPYLSQSDWLQAQTNDNKQGNLNRDEVMRILHHLSMTRFTSGHKVVVIWGADYLGEESNRLLKAIEEPPANTLILLITTRFERILPTITSRCQLLRLNLPADEEVTASLVARGLAPSQAEAIAYTAGGDLAQAFVQAKLFDAEGSDGPDLAGWLRDCFVGKGAAIVQTSTALAALTREQQKHFLLRALNFTRELGVVAAGTPRPLKLATAERAVATRLASIISWPQLTAMAAELETLLQAVERNANGKIAFTASSIRLHHILASHSQDTASAKTPLRRAS